MSEGARIIVGVRSEGGRVVMGVRGGVAKGVLVLRGDSTGGVVARPRGVPEREGIWEGGRGRVESSEFALLL